MDSAGGKEPLGELAIGHTGFRGRERESLFISTHNSHHSTVSITLTSMILVYIFQHHDVTGVHFWKVMVLSPIYSLTQYGQVLVFGYFWLHSFLVRFTVCAQLLGGTQT